MNGNATAVAHPNIAFIKYWGNRDDQLRIPANGSISMTLSGLETRTKVEFDPALERDELTINGESMHGEGLRRVSRLLNRVRDRGGHRTRAVVTSRNNFPMGAGIASSSSAFAALSLAASAAAGLALSEQELSRLARTGSGSACRSIPGGFVEWHPGTGHEDSFATSFAGPEHWPLVDLIAVISSGPKETGSTRGHTLAGTSPLQEPRVKDAPRRLARCRRSILERDFNTFAEVVERDSDMMHAVMMTSQPPLMYWHPGTIRIMREVRGWRQRGLPACYTVDAGPNVHVLCLPDVQQEVERRLRHMEDVKGVYVTSAGKGAYLSSKEGDKV